MVRTRVTKRDKRGRTRAGPASGPRNVGSTRDSGTNDGYEVAALQSVIADPEASAMAKVSAARTLAEMDGRLGRHQAAPERGDAMGLSVLSRDQLAQELDRLRTLIDFGLVPKG
jgi:hypothetical protein